MAIAVRNLRTRTRTHSLPPARASDEPLLRPVNINCLDRATFGLIVTVKTCPALSISIGTMKFSGSSSNIGHCCGSSRREIGEAHDQIKGADVRTRLVIINSQIYKLLVHGCHFIRRLSEVINTGAAANICSNFQLSVTGVWK